MNEISEKYVNVASFDALAEHGIAEVVIAIGVFDGVHEGHQVLLKELVSMAERTGARPVALTFYPHPREVLEPENTPSLLIPPARRVELLHDYGCEAVVTIPFSREFAELSAEDFIKDCLFSPRVSIKGICVGKGWKFGAGAMGDIGLLKAYAKKGHFDFRPVGELEIDGRPVSSTFIRQAVSAGRLDDAAAMLGRSYALSGTVEKGRKIAGPELECPTANLKFRFGVLPPNGVYAGRAIVDGKSYVSALAVGVSPTFREHDDRHRRVEAHILDFSGDLYGRRMELEFVEYLREERCFSSTESLKQQISDDIEKIKAIMNKRGYGK